MLSQCLNRLRKNSGPHNHLANHAEIIVQPALVVVRPLPFERGESNMQVISIELKQAQ